MILYQYDTIRWNIKQKYNQMEITFKLYHITTLRWKYFYLCLCLRPVLHEGSDARALIIFFHGCMRSPSHVSMIVIVINHSRYNDLSGEGSKQRRRGKWIHRLHRCNNWFYSIILLKKIEKWYRNNFPKESMHYFWWFIKKCLYFDMYVILK